MFKGSTYNYLNRGYAFLFKKIIINFLNKKETIFNFQKKFSFGPVSENGATIKYLNMI
jgi:hypothetical protein